MKHRHLMQQTGGLIPILSLRSTQLLQYEVLEKLLTCIFAFNIFLQVGHCGMSEICRSKAILTQLLPSLIVPFTVILKTTFTSIHPFIHPGQYFLIAVSNPCKDASMNRRECSMFDRKFNRLQLQLFKLLCLSQVVLDPK